MEWWSTGGNWCLSFLWLSLYGFLYGALSPPHTHFPVHTPNLNSWAPQIHIFHRTCHAVVVFISPFNSIKFHESRDDNSFSHPHALPMHWKMDVCRIPAPGRNHQCDCKEGDIPIRMQSHWGQGFGSAHYPTSENGAWLLWVIKKYTLNKGWLKSEFSWGRSWR